MPPERGQLPRGWTSEIIYLTIPAHSSSLTQSHTSALSIRPKDALDIPLNTPKGPCPLVRIAPITTPSHPARGQNGLFAAKDLKPGTFILQYIGEIHASLHPKPSSYTPGSDVAVADRSSLETDVRPTPRLPDPHADSNYDLSLDRDHGIGIDAEKKGNEARFVNDYRGVAERPNAEFKEVWDGRRRERGMGVWVLPEGKSGKGKGIRKGEEILISYGRGFWGARSGD